MDTYRNSFYNKDNQDSKPFIKTDAKPVEYKGYLIYKRFEKAFDIVKDGVCVGMYAGLKGAKNRIDNL